MFIPYDKLSNTLALFMPYKLRKKLRSWGYEMKLQRNCNYIKNNEKNVLQKLVKKVKNQKLVVAFVVYDAAKWKCQSLYDLLDRSENFVPYIFVTKNCAPKENFNFQKPEEIKKVFDFFDSQKMRVCYAFDFEKSDYIPFEKMQPQPDLIFYQIPWYIHSSQGPVISSKLGLTFYVPYYIATSVVPTEYGLRFHEYVQNYYVLNEDIKKYYSENMHNNGSNLKSVGHPMLDYFFLNKDQSLLNQEYVIYAPHWSIDKKNNLAWGTFLWSGKFMLDYAKKHPEINWLFKPHPCLKGYLVNQNYMTLKEADDYWREWDCLGSVCETGNYLDLFMESKAMITDCGSFEIEYFMTKKPLIHLKSPDATTFNPLVEKIVSSYYEADNKKDLQMLLDDVVIKNNDAMMNTRLKLLKEINLDNNYCAQKILDDIKLLLHIGKK